MCQLFCIFAVAVATVVVVVSVIDATACLVPPCIRRANSDAIEAESLTEIKPNPI